jgi:pyridoxine kinase
MIREAAASLAPGVALVSSAHARTPEAAANLLAARGLPTQLIETPLLASAPNGTGDLLTAVFAGRLALGASPSEAAAVAVAAVHDVIRVTADIGHDELAIVEAQANLAVPSTIPAVSVMPD